VEPSALDAIASVSLNWAGRSWRTDSERFSVGLFFFMKSGPVLQLEPVLAGSGLAVAKIAREFVHPSWQRH